MQELSRVLKSGGCLYLTVPFGTQQRFGGFQQFNSDLLAQALEAFGNASAITKMFYHYGMNGWNLATEEECARCEYVDWVGRAFSGEPWPEPLRCEPDHAAAARAVACVRIVK
jgi:hypothetical protein